MRPFWIYWTAARLVLGGADPGDYPHHRVADPTAFSRPAERCGWTNVAVERVTSGRVVDGDELWAWLHQTLPVRAGTGGWVDPHIVAHTAEALRHSVLDLAAADRAGDVYRLRSTCWLITAHRPPE